MNYADIQEKVQFIEEVMIAIENAGYSNPGYYVSDDHGIPYIFDRNGNPRQSVAGDSPTAMIVDLAHVIEEDR